MSVCITCGVCALCMHLPVVSAASSYSGRYLSFYFD